MNFFDPLWDFIKNKSEKFLKKILRKSIGGPFPEKPTLGDQRKKSEKKKFEKNYFQFFFKIFLSLYFFQSQVGLFQNLRPLAQYHNISLPSVIELEYTRKLGPPAAPLNPPPGPPWGSKKISGGFRHLVRSNPCQLAQETSQNHHLGLLSPPLSTELERCALLGFVISLGLVCTSLKNSVS